ncbi:MAG TPA: helix-turn-helix domain-containing protein [Thermoplasmata archaeon]|jgi:sugar-specific transcriptional regulator TrmB|nr:helix-turn-helix domain-containing protein [Thermoplasmata archaeon]
MPARSPPPPLSADPAEPDSSNGTDELTRGLTHLGLTVHEAQMYRAVVRNGPVTARHAIAASQLDRATGYRILARLAARGLVVPTGRRPHRYVGLDVGRLLDRATVFLRDEVDLHRVVRAIYLAESPQRQPGLEDGEPVVRPLAPRPMVPGRTRIIPKDEELAPDLLQRINSARQEVQALSRPGVFAEGARVDVAKALQRACERGVRVQLVVDYRATDLEFLARLLAVPGTTSNRPEVRIWTPQLARLWVIDRKVAIRGFGALSPPRPGGGPLVESFDEEFVRQNSMRFETVWREATPLAIGAQELAELGGEGAKATFRTTPSETTRRPGVPREAAYRASLPDATELAIGRMFRA